MCLITLTSFLATISTLLLFWYLFITRTKQKYFSTNEKNNNEQMKRMKNESRFETTPLTWLPERNFTFHECLKNIPQNANSPKTDQKNLVLLFAWLFAPERHLDKYRQLYLQRGFDVLTIKANIWDVLLPPLGSQQIAAAVVQFLVRQGPSYTGYICHTFSMGGYQMGEVFVRLKEESYKKVEAETFEKIKGIIYDSALDYHEAPRGLSKVTSNSTALQWAIRGLMKLYMRACYSVVTRHYKASSAEIQAHRCRAPILIFFSKDDPITYYGHQMAVCSRWRQAGQTVTSQCWNESVHVGHMFKYPEEYQSLLKQFLVETVKIVEE